MTLTMITNPPGAAEGGSSVQDIPVVVHPSWTATPAVEACDPEVVFVQYLDGPEGGNA